MTSFSQDIGGLNYAITAKNQFSGTFRAFKKEVKEAKAEWRSLKSSMKGSRAAFRNAASDIRKSATAAQAARSQAKKLNATNRESVEAFNARRAAIRKVNNETRRQATAQAAADVAAKRGYVNEVRLTTAMQDRQAAHKRLTAEIARTKRQQELVNAAEERGIKLSDESRRRLGLQTKQEKELAQARERLAAAQRKLNDDNLRSLNAEAEAARKRAAYLQRLESKRSLQKAGFNPDGSSILGNEPKSKQTLRDRIKDLFTLEKSQDAAAKAGSRLLFTFRRLVGVLALFTLARKVTQGIGALIRESVRFNAQIETATLGIASLLTAVGEVRDASGGLVTDSRALALAQKEARRQVQLLRADALKTTATFDQLLDTFQIALSPGFQAGLDVEEIRNLTVRISQAAAAIGLPQNQLAEEIRSLLSGTIQARTTRIAVALGITNEDIRNAREAGNLADFLQDRFAAFGVAGEEALNTFNGVLNRLKDGISLLVGSGGLEFFEALKSVLKDVLNFITVADPLTGLIEPNPKAVSLLERIGGVLALIVRQARAVAASLNFDKVIASFTLLGGAASAVIVVFSGLIQGVVQGLTDVLAGLLAIGQAIARGFGFDSATLNLDGLREAIALVTRILTILIGIRLVLLVIRKIQFLINALTFIWSTVTGTAAAVTGLVTAAWGLVTGAIGVATGAATAFNVVVGGIPFLVGLIVAIVIAIGVAMGFLVNEARKWLGDLLGIELRLLTILKIVKIQLVGAFTVLFLTVQKGWLRVTGAARIAMLRIRNYIVNSARSVIETLLRALSFVSDAAADELKKLQQQRKDDLAAQQDLITAEQERLRLLEKRIDAAKRLSQIDTQRKIGQAIEDNEDTPTLAGIANGILDAVSGGLEGVFSRLTPELEDVLGGIDETNQESSKLSDTFRDLPGIIANSRKPLEANTELVKELRSEAERAQDALRVGLGVLGIGGDTARVRERVLEAEVTAFRKSADLRRQAITFQQDIVGTQARIVRNQQAINRLSEEDQQRVREGIEAAKEVLGIQRQITEAEKSVAVAQSQFQRANREGNLEDIEAARVRVSSAQSVLDSLQETLRLRLSESDAILEGSDNQKELTRIITDTLKLQAELTGLEDNLNATLEDRAALLRRINEIRDDELSLIAERNALELSRELENAAIDFRKQVAESVASNLNPDRARLVLQEAELDAAKARLAINERDRRGQELALRSTIEQLSAEQRKLQLLKAQTENTDELEELQSQIEANTRTATSLERNREALVRRNALARLQENFELQETLRLAQEARAAVEQPITTGFVEGLRRFVEETPTLFQSVAEGVEGALRSIGAEVSRIIVDVADPTQDVEFATRVGKFFLQVAQQFIGQIINALIAQLILSAGLLSTATNPGATALLAAAVQMQFAGASLFASTVPLQTAADTLLTAAILLASTSFAGGGLRHGGAVGLREGGMPGSFLHAKGYRGGKVPHRPVPRSRRPRGLHFRDSVPAWLDPREYVVRGEGVMAAGVKALNVINSGNFSRPALHAALGISGSSPAMAGSPSAAITGAAIGMRDGGFVNDREEQRQGPRTAAESGSTSSGAVGVLVTNEETGRRIYSGSRIALREAVADEWPAIKALAGDDT